MFHVYRQPLPNASINLEVIPDGEASGGGTFRGAFTGGNDKGDTPTLPYEYNHTAQAGVITVIGSLVRSIFKFLVFVFCFFPVKNCFRVSSRGRSKAHPYSLQANDSFSKQQWITCLRQAIVQSRDEKAQTSQSQLSLHPDPALYHIAELSLGSSSDIAGHTSR